MKCLHYELTTSQYAVLYRYIAACYNSHLHGLHEGTDLTYIYNANLKAELYCSLQQLISCDVAP